ncbi:MAG: carotenoid oxygenase family protein, partial [Hyphomicrobiales bacterium]|nr:carotenoid oxygenase family protein [Hyphomicrobiales bacterium]
MTNIVENLIRDAVGKGAEAVANFNRARLPDEANAYLSAIHEPMKQELTLDELEVIGAIPRELDGRYLRIGPNPAKPDSKGYHWFSGDGMVHGLALEDGKALWYRNRWIRSNAVAAATGLPAAPGPRHVFDTVNTNVVGIAGRTWALVEAGSYPVSLSDTLEDQAYERFGDTLNGSFTAHPHLDPLTGEF